MHLHIARREAANAGNGLPASSQDSDPCGCALISVWTGLVLLSAERKGGKRENPSFLLDIQGRIMYDI